jgi:hypothetical protein
MLHKELLNKVIKQYDYKEKEEEEEAVFLT